MQLGRGGRVISSPDDEECDSYGTNALPLSDNLDVELTPNEDNEAHAV